MIFGLLDSSQRDEHFDMCLISVRSILTEISIFEVLVTRDLSYLCNMRGPMLLASDSISLSSL